MTALEDMMTAKGYDLNRKNALVNVLTTMNNNANYDWYPAVPDYTGCYSDTDSNALWVSGNLIKKGGNAGVGGTTIRLKGVGLANLIYEDAVGLVTEILADPAYASANIIRLPVYDDDWEQKTVTERNTHFNTVILPCINLISAAGKYAIVDYHAVKEWGSFERFILVCRFWDDMAPRLKGLSNVLIEFFNEPSSPNIYPWPADLNNYIAFKTIYQKAVDRIRALAPKNIIIVGSPAYSARTIHAQTTPFVGTNLVYTSHAYPNFTGGLKTYLGMTNNAASSTTILNNSIPTNVPVLMTEIGYSSSPAIPGETSLDEDIYYPPGMADHLIATKNVHPIIWAVSIYGLGTKNASGSAMKVWWGNLLPLLTT